MVEVATGDDWTGRSEGAGLMGGDWTGAGRRIGDAGAEGGAWICCCLSARACSSSKHRIRAASRSCTRAVRSSILWTAADK